MISKPDPAHVVLLHPIQIVAATLAEWVRREQEKRIEFLQEELDILREQFGDRRILLTDDERRVLAVKGMALDRRIWRKPVSSYNLTHFVVGIAS